ncbi:MAG: HlyD family secretion protein, partial [Betaproteobacteria bacterium]|nr:HlyD family secretion protein [Betaproteobacteria bacterium]
ASMKADIRVDAFPDKVFHGQVFRIGQAATSKFALLPDPNPSGNFTKITQRLPVRLLLTDKDPTLRPGMMVEVDVDVRDH